MARWSLDTCTSTVYIVYFLIFFFSFFFFSYAFYSYSFYFSFLPIFSFFSGISSHGAKAHHPFVDFWVGIGCGVFNRYGFRLVHPTYFFSTNHDSRDMWHASKASARPDTLRGQSTQHNTAHTEGLARGVFDDGIYADPLANGMSTGEVRIAHRMRARVGVYT